MLYANIVIFIALFLWASTLSNKILRIKAMRVASEKRNKALADTLDKRQREIDRQTVALDKKADENFQESCELLYTYLRMNDKKPPLRDDLTYPEWYEKLMDIQNGYVEE